MHEKIEAFEDFNNFLRLAEAGRVTVKLIEFYLKKFKQLGVVVEKDGNIIFATVREGKVVLNLPNASYANILHEMVHVSQLFVRLLYEKDFNPMTLTILQRGLGENQTSRIVDRFISTQGGSRRDRGSNNANLSAWKTTLERRGYLIPEKIVDPYLISDEQDYRS